MHIQIDLTLSRYTVDRYFSESKVPTRLDDFYKDSDEHKES